MKFIHFFIFICSGSLIGISFLTPALYWGFVPGYILFLCAINKENSYRKVFAFGALAGTLAYGGSLFWFFNTYPVAWVVESSASIQFAIIAVYWLASSAVMGMAYGLFAVCAKRVLRCSSAVLLLPAFWVGAEVFGAFLFSIYSLGEGGYVNADFSFGNVGYLLSQNSALLPFAAVLDLYGLSFVAVMFLSAVYLMSDKYTYKKMFPKVILGICFFGMLIVPILIHTQYARTGQSVIAVETYFNKKFMQESDNAYQKAAMLKEAVSAALRESPDVIILPEDSRLYENFYSPKQTFEWIAQIDPSFEGSLIDSGAVIDERDKAIVRVFLYDMKTRSMYSFDKQYLVPQGEFMPYLHGKIASYLMSEKKYEDVYEEISHSPGLLLDSKTIPEYLPSILFCFESVSPSGVQKAQAVRHPSFVAHLVSHAWFSDPYSFWYQLDSMLMVQAVNNKVPIVSAGNMSPSKLYLPTGAIEEGKTIKRHDLWSLIEFEL